MLQMLRALLSAVLHAGPAVTIILTLLLSASSGDDDDDDDD